MVLRLDVTQSLQEAPPGSHEFAEGFLLFSRMLRVQGELGNKNMWWEANESEKSHLKPTGVHVQVTPTGHSIMRTGRRRREGGNRQDE